MMAIYASSDFHFGAGNANDFRRNDAFFKAYSSLKDDHWVLNGDILDLWESNPKDIYQAHKRKIDLIREDSRIILVLGNHDLDLKDPHILAECGLDYKTVRSIRIIDDTLFLHGYQFDPFISKYPTAAEFISFLGSQIERIFPNLDIYFRRLEQRINKVGRYCASNKDYAAKAISLASDISGIKKVILGHTHRRCVAKTKGIKYINLGCCIGKKFNFIQIN